MYSDTASATARNGASVSDPSGVVDALLKILIEVVKDHCGAEAASLLLYDARLDELFFDVALGEADEKLKRVRLSASSGVAGHVFRTKQPVLAADVERDQHFSAAADAATGFKTHSIIAVPIGDGSHPDLGVVEAINRQGEPPRFGQTDLERLVALQPRLSRAVLAAQQVREGGTGAMAAFYRALFDIVAQRASELQQRDHDLSAARRSFDRERSKLFVDEKLAALSRLVAGLAHEFNNPLSFVSCNLDTLHSYVSELARVIGAIEEDCRQGGRDAAAQVARLLDEQRVRETLRDTFELIDESKVGLERLCHISNRLHTFSGTSASNAESVDCNELVSMAVKLFEGGPGGRVQLQLYQGAMPRVRAVRSRLQAAVLELLDNALRAGAGDSQIRLATHAADGQVEIVVSDDGCGMTTDDQARVFDPFFTDKSKHWRSTGLGLSAAYGIVAELGGRIDVTSDVGHGSVFAVHLPTEAVAAMAGGSLDDGNAKERR